jgi:ribonuclease PH
MLILALIAAAHLALRDTSAAFVTIPLLCAVAMSSVGYTNHHQPE